ncbi:MAG: hypothetical protein R3A51_08495 [Nannocystaceae bacterium]
MSLLQRVRGGASLGRVAWLLAAALACGAPEPSQRAAAAAVDAPLAPGLTSLAAVGEAVVAGLNSRDADALAGLLVREEDFTGRLYPALSRHQAGAQADPAFLFHMQRRESLDDIGHALDAYGGGALEFVAVEPARVERRPGVTLHREPRLVVRDGGRLRRLRLLASIIEHDATHTFTLLAFKLRGEEE